MAFAQAAGKADLASGRNAEPSTRYAVGSISKQFTVAALLLLQNKASCRSTTRSRNTIPT